MMKFPETIKHTKASISMLTKMSIFGPIQSEKRVSRADFFLVMLMSRCTTKI